MKMNRKIYGIVAGVIVAAIAGAVAMKDKLPIKQVEHTQVELPAADYSAAEAIVQEFEQAAKAEAAEAAK